MEKKNSDKAKKIILSICVLVFIVFVFYIITGTITKYTGRTITGGAIKTEVMEKFVKCLGENDVKMYGVDWCGHCANQKKLFGEGVLEENNIYVKCEDNGEGAKVCSEKGIGGYPTWEINRKLYPGEQNLKKLSELSGCEI